MMHIIVVQFYVNLKHQVPGILLTKILYNQTKLAILYLILRKIIIKKNILFHKEQIDRNLLVKQWPKHLLTIIKKKVNHLIILL